MRLINAIVEASPAIARIRRDIHAHPELAFQETRTAALVAAMLRAWGIDVHEGLAGTGVVGVIRNGASRRAIGLRADMDALPLQEANEFAHASRYAGRMHACGHDGHTAMLLAAAQHLARYRNFDGTVYLIFQPAEEAGGGARKMIEEGLFERFPMESIFALHNAPSLPAGTFALTSGLMMASSSDFSITVHGEGSPSAPAPEGVNPIIVACAMVQAFQTILTRNKDPESTAVISVTKVSAGESPSAAPGRCEMAGTVRTFSTSVLDLIERRMKTLAGHTCAAHNARCDFTFARNYPPTINHFQEARFMQDVMARIVGLQNVLVGKPSMSAEDFAYMLQACPGAYALIGAGDGSHRDAGHGQGPCSVHNPSYDFNDALIPLGATLWVRMVEAWLEGRGLQ